MIDVRKKSKKQRKYEDCFRSLKIKGEQEGRSKI